MSGERPSNSDLPTQIQQTPTTGSGTPVPDGTLVVAHGADVKSASAMKVDFRDDATESHLSLIGKWIGPYKIQAELGAGGMGAVYLAEQVVPVRRQVALKVIKAGMDSEDVLARFQSERELLARMNHPNIAQVLDVGATPEGRLYFAMEYVPGVPVNEFCDRRGMDIAHRLELFLQICEGVQHAHQKGVIHRDIKPSNLMVADYHGQLLVKVIDFGIAKSMDAHGRGDTGSTRVGVPIGTPAYMSPEQAAGDLAAIDTRTDVYSLGVVLYRMITHDLPISADTIAKAIDVDLARVLREATIRPPSRKVLEIAKDAKVNQADWKRAMASDAPALSRTLKGDLDWITLKALERERDQRYASVSEFAADVRRYLQGEVVLAGPPSKLYRARKFIARNKLAVSAAAAVVLSLILGIIGTTYMTLEAQQQRARAEAALKDAQQQRDRAESESARAIATRSFLEEMIAAPDPWKLQGGSPETRNVRVVDALQTAATNLEKSLADKPALRAEIATMLGRTLRRLGQLEAAEAQLTLARDGLQGVDAPVAARELATSELAILMAERGRFVDANVELAKVASAESLSVELADELAHVRAVVATSLGRAEDGERLARSHLMTVAKRDGGTGTALSAAKATLADIIGGQGQFDEADRLIQDALVSERLRLGESHPIVFSLLRQSGDLAFRTGRYELALARYEAAARLAENVLGDSHPRTLALRANAATALANTGEHERAVPMLRHWVEAMTQTLGEDSDETLIARSNYAYALRSAGRLPEATSEMTGVYQLRRSANGDTHPETLRAINALGIFAREQGDLGSADVLLQQAASLHAKANGQDHPETLMMSNNMFAVARDLGDLPRALAGFSELLPRAERVFNADHWHLAAIRGNYGQTLTAAGRAEEAMTLLEQSLATIAAQFGREDPRFEIAATRLRRAAESAGRAADAESLINRLSRN